MYENVFRCGNLRSVSPEVVLLDRLLNPFCLTILRDDIASTSPYL